MDLETNITPLNLRPLQNNIYYEWLTLPDTINGIRIPEYRRVSMRKAVVHAVGPTCEMLQPGDKILVSIHTGVHMFLCVATAFTDGEKHRMCREDEVISLYAETPEETEAIDIRHAKEREDFLKKLQNELEE